MVRSVMKIICIFICVLISPGLWYGILFLLYPAWSCCLIKLEDYWYPTVGRTIYASWHGWLRELKLESLFEIDISFVDSCFVGLGCWFQGWSFAKAWSLLDVCNGWRRRRFYDSSGNRKVSTWFCYELHIKFQFCPWSDDYILFFNLVLEDLKMSQCYP